MKNFTLICVTFQLPFFAQATSRSISKSLWNAIEFTLLGTLENSCVSSANLLLLEVIPVSESLMYRIKSRGPRTLLFVTPLSTGYNLELAPFKIHVAYD